MTRFTSGTTFAICLALAVTADGWADKPLPTLAGAGIALTAVIALAGLARARMSPLWALMESAVAEKARANQSEAGGDRKSLLQKSEKAVNPVHTDETLAQMAGAPRDTMEPYTEKGRPALPTPDGPSGTNS